MRFYIPLTISTNDIYAGLHYQVRRMHKNLYRAVPIEDKERITDFPCHLSFHFCIENNFDISNLSYMQKLIEDVMVKQGVLPNDSRKYVSGITITAEKSKDNYCEITQA